MSLIIRDVTQADRAAWDSLWQAYLVFYEHDLSAEMTDLTWSRFFDSAEPVHCMVAQHEGEVIGFAHYVFHRSTWLRGDACYLDDLFVASEARGQGVGRKLIETLYKRAREAGAERVYWVTQESNKTAQRLYDTLAQKPGNIQYRVEFT